MTYKNALNYIENTYLFGANPSLSRMKKLLDLIGNPQNSLKYVHVAGTNGKGSTSSAVASVLEEAGYKTGLYTSPYITDFRERIKVNGEMIKKSELVKEVEYIIPFVEKAAKDGFKPTEFEIITAIGFDYFKKKGCEIVVLEVGLGGRYDATNVIDNSIVSVITAISYDHTKLLGNTLTEIAGEKSGIIKHNGTCVVSPSQETEALETIMKNCAEQNSMIILPNENAVKIKKESLAGTDIEYGTFSFHIPLPGRHQIRNFLTALEAIKTVKKNGFNISDENIKKGFSKVRFAARLEVLNKSPLVLVDGAHNPSGTAALADAIKRYLTVSPVVIMGMLKDKDYETSVKEIALLSKSFIAVKPESPRALEAEKTAETAKQYCTDSNYENNYLNAFKSALNKSGNGPIVICGSLYLAGKMRKTVKDYFKNKNKEKS